MTEVTIPINIVVFFGAPIAYDVILRRRSPAVWGLHSHNFQRSVLLGILASIATFPLAYIAFKVFFNFSTDKFGQSGTVAYYFYTEFAYPFNLIYYVAWTFLVIASGEELFFRGFVHKKLEDKLAFAKANMVSSSIFTLAHLLSIFMFTLPMMLTYLALSFLVSVLLAYVLHSTGNLVGCWISHAISNTLAAIFIGIL